jgi:hypothetical protein
LSSENKGVCVFSADGVNFFVLVHIGALGFGLPGGLDDWNSHKPEHIHDIFLFCFGNVGGSLLLFQGLGQISDFLGFLFLFDGLLFDFSSSQDLTILFAGWFSVKDPDRFDSMFEKHTGSIEDTQKVAGFVALAVRQICEIVGVG